jgi:hypothetical protein
MTRRQARKILSNWGKPYNQRQLREAWRVAGMFNNEQDREYFWSGPLNPSKRRRMCR